MARYGTSLWLGRVPKTRRPSYPVLREQIDADVAIVGAGLTGCLAAFMFASAGVRVVLLEAGGVGEGGSGASSGIGPGEPEASFAETAARYGLRDARHVWQQSRRSALELSALIRRLRIRCELTRSDLIRFAETAEERTALERDYKARRGAGLDVTSLRPARLRSEAGVAGAGGIRTGECVQIDPYRAALGFAAAASKRGARIFERSPAARVRAGRKQVEIVTPRGGLSAQTVIIATGAPLRDLRQLRRHFRSLESYVVQTDPLPAGMRRELGRTSAALIDSASPPHVIRRLADDSLLVAGADQAPVRSRSQPAVLRQRTGQLMYELSRIYPAISGLPAAAGWSAPYVATVDGLPFIGTHRNFPRHLFALGLGRHGLALAPLAARILVRHFTGEPAKRDDVLGFARLADARI
jgi:glycine/D-amino acid oxidase-like deaminating enzyme